jgi:threonine-phosphate decarboxylase
LFETAGLEQPHSILDFSENVHPFGPPGFMAESWQDMLELIRRYPDPDAEPFRSAAAVYHGIEPQRVAAGNGAAEIFTWLARRYRGKRVVLIEPAFSEYRKTLEAEGAEIIAVQLTEENGWRLQLAEVMGNLTGSAALYICNPHNPTGRLLSQRELVCLAEACREADCELVLDEAFIDFAGEQYSLIGLQKEFSNLVIVRSMSKMYAIPGLRLGYVIADPVLVAELKQGAAHWNVNAISANLGARCFSEAVYREQVVKAAVREREGMERFLDAHGCEAADSAVNFMSFRLPQGNDPKQFFMDMLKSGVVLRHTESFRGMDGRWFRIGMKAPEAMERLREAMEAWLVAE